MYSAIDAIIEFLVSTLALVARDEPTATAEMVTSVLDALEMARQEGGRFTLDNSFDGVDGAAWSARVVVDIGCSETIELRFGYSGTQYDTTSVDYVHSADDEQSFSIWH